MVKSGETFEGTVSVYSLLTVNCIIKNNYRFYSPRIFRGTETDVIIITNSKIYCVECKNFNGYLSGSRLDLEWTFTSSGKKGSVLNPVLSNSKHVRTIRSLLRVSGNPLYDIESVVCVPDGTQIHTECSEVINLSTFMRVLKRDSELPTIYNIEDVSRVLDELKWESEVKL